MFSSPSSSLFSLLFFSIAFPDRPRKRSFISGINIYYTFAPRKKTRSFPTAPWECTPRPRRPSTSALRALRLPPDIGLGWLAVCVRETS